MPKQIRMRGFSLLELMIGLTLVMITSGSAFSLLNAYQKHYGSTVLKADLHSGLRNATELLQQEIGQAGLVSFTPATLTAAVTGGSAAQNAAVASNSGMYIGQKLRIDIASAQETVAITQCGPPCGTGTANTITGIFRNDHTAGDVVLATGTFSQGIQSSSSATQLNMFGDINADGTVVFVQYNCDMTAGTLTRSVTPITANAKTAAVVLLDNLQTNPVPSGGGSAPPCFRYSTATTVTASSGATYTFIPGVGVTLTVRTVDIDPNTRAYVQETKAFLNLAPRNIVFGLRLAQDSREDSLQPNPPGCLLQGTC